jgi:hypothetical protein
MITLTLLIWWCGIALEALLLFRGFRARLVSRYPYFYIYVLSLFLTDGLLCLVFLSKPTAYDKWNWYAGFLILFLGCGILLEVFRHVLSPYPGAERFARMAGFAVFGAIFCFAIVYPIYAPAPSVARALYVVVQRDFLSVQAILLLGLLQVISYYRISMGRNLKGMIVGYGQCLGTTVIAIALRSHIGPRFDYAWDAIQPLAYLASLIIWLVALWSYCPNKVPKATISVEADYEALAARTRDMMGEAGTQMVKVDRL